MKTTQQLHNTGQRLWLDDLSRRLLRSGTLRRYIEQYSLTGLTSNPTTFDHAIAQSNDYDEAIRSKTLAGKSGEELFMELALEDLREAADLFRPIYEASAGVDGWVSLELSPLLAHDAYAAVQAARQIYAQAQRANLFIKIPGNEAGLVAIEEAIFSGVPVNVTLLFSAAQYSAAAHAYMRGIERRLAAGLGGEVASVASLFVSRWDSAVNERTPPELHNRLGIAIAMRTYKVYRDLLASPRWKKLVAAGARPQRLLWASTGSKDASTADTWYVQALAAPDTICTMPEKTLLALADHGQLRDMLPLDGGYAETVITKFIRAGIDDEAMAKELQRAGEEKFTASWRNLMASIAAKSPATAVV